ncbi:MAG: hypothetical protein KY475_14340 [Planctomycetes bacterium]|nr:hypothetical protein [Planctomycetota bacterium]
MRRRSNALAALNYARTGQERQSAGGTQSGRAGKLRRTAAMMAGVTDRLWRFQDFFDELLVTA